MPVPQVSVILPTFNERSALASLHPRLVEGLRPFTAEILVVDDGSPDGTGDLVRELATDGVYRLIERPYRSGLASAVSDGFREARGEVVVVMDADGSHPPEAIPALVGPVVDGRAEMVLASRHLPGASSPGLAGVRRWISGGAAALARPLTAVTDPMSGFFAIHRAVLGRGALTPAGFKIGLEVIVKCHPSPIVEIPFCFDRRIAGSSKLGSGQIFGYLRHLSRLYAHAVFRTAPARRPSPLPLLPVATHAALYYSGPAAPQRVEDRAEARERKAGRPRFAHQEVLAAEVEGEPGEGARYGDREEPSGEEGEGAFPAAAPRADGIVAH